MKEYLRKTIQLESRDGRIKVRKWRDSFGQSSFAIDLGGEKELRFEEDLAVEFADMITQVANDPCLLPDES